MSQSKQDLEDCWLFAGLHMNNGYGYFANGYAHRHLFEISYRPLKKGEVVRHKCDVRLCINPAHLEPGTVQDNVRDMVKRGRSAKGIKHSQAKLTETQVMRIRALKGEMTNVAIAKLFDVHRTCIDKINRGEHWRHI